MLLWIFLYKSVWTIPMTAIAGSYGKFMFNFIFLKSQIIFKVAVKFSCSTSKVVEFLLFYLINIFQSIELSLFNFNHSNLCMCSGISDQIRSVAQSCPTLCDPMIHSTPGLPVHHQLPEFTQTHDHRVSGAIQPSHPLSSPSPPAPNPSQHQSLFQWVNSLHQVAKVLEL